MSRRETRCWAVIPAAGSGRRMGADRPKQYLDLHGRPVLQHSLERMLSHPRVAGAVVSLSADDPYWPRLERSFAKPVWIAPGGRERVDSVLAALIRLGERADDGDWVLVHDAARPCLRPADLDRLISTLYEHPVGGLLGLPVADTVKRVTGNGEVLETIDRNGLWRALTPQMFRLGALRRALERALAAGCVVTDDASAMELAGAAPRMVRGSADNIKITHAEDLPLAALYLQRQFGEGAGKPSKGAGEET